MVPECPLYPRFTVVYCEAFEKISFSLGYPEKNLSVLHLRLRSGRMKWTCSFRDIVYRGNVYLCNYEMTYYFARDDVWDIRVAAGVRRPSGKLRMGVHFLCVW